MTENEDTPRLRALEFYSGIGGMHHALRLAAPNSEVVKAFEISDVANAVYKHNFNTPVHQVGVHAGMAANGHASMLFALTATLSFSRSVHTHAST